MTVMPMASVLIPESRADLAPQCVSRTVKEKVWRGKKGQRSSLFTAHWHCQFDAMVTLHCEHGPTGRALSGLALSWL